jgi:flagellar protein FlaG
MATDIQGVSSVAFALPGEGVRAFAPARAAALPSSAVESARDAAEAAVPVDLETALDELAARASESGAQLDFRIDEDSGRVVVSIVDRSDGTVLRQMPSEEALRIARSLARYEPHLIEVRA